MTNGHLESGAQAVTDISSAILKAAGECLKFHGPDPNSAPILSAGFCMAIDQITRNIDPQFRALLLVQLQEDENANDSGEA